LSLLKNAERGADRRSFRHHKGILIVPVSGPKPRLYPRRKSGLSGPPTLPRRTGPGELCRNVEQPARDLAPPLATAAALEGRKATLASVLAKAGPDLRLNEHLDQEDGEAVFR
jgi:hypothetical protein